MNVYKKVYPLFLLLSLLLWSSCSFEEDERKDSLFGSKGISFHLNVKNFENEDLSTRSGVESASFDTLVYYITDDSGEMVTGYKGVFDTLNSQIIVGGLGDGNYRLLVLGVKGDMREDGATIHELTDSSSAWLTFDEKTPARSLKAEYYYVSHPFSVTEGKVEELSVYLSKAMGMVDFRMPQMSDYVHKSTQVLCFVPTAESKCYSVLHADGTRSGSRGIDSISLLKQSQILLFPTTTGSMLEGKIVLNTINHRKEKFESEYHVQTSVEASRQSSVQVQMNHPDTREGIQYNLSDEFIREGQFYTILTDSEPPATYFNANQRSFKVAEPLQIEVMNDSLHLRFYSPIALKEATIMAKSDMLDRYVEFAYFDSIPAFADVKVPIKLLDNGMYRTDTGELRALTSDKLPLGSLSFKVSSPDPYWAKLSRIKAKWYIKFASYGADPVTGVHNGNWRGIRPVHVREAVALFLNIGYMCTMDEFNEEVLKYQGKINDNNGKPVDMSKIVNRLANLGGFNVGLVWTGNGVAGLGGGRTWGVYQPGFFNHYGNAGACTVIFHELGHCLGYSHNSGMTYGAWSTKCANNFYVKHISEFPVNDWKILNSRNNPNRYK